MDQELISVLLVDDDDDDFVLVRDLLAEASWSRFDLEWTKEYEDALEIMDQTRHHIYLVDYRLGERNGLELMRAAIAGGCNGPIILLTGQGCREVDLSAMKAGAADYLAKDHLSAELLERSIRYAIERKRTEHDIRRHALELQARNEDLDAFAHTVAHDLRTPLGSIIGFAEQLEEFRQTMSKEEIQECLQIILQVGYKMSSIIHELLLLAGVRKKEDVQRTPLNTARIVKEARMRLTRLIKEHGSEIIVPETWPLAIGYGPWVEEVWVNYISNAILYGGRPPHVEIGATEQPDGMVLFSVRDNGPGLAPKEKERLFTPFTRLEQVRSTGYGLGLSIVRRIVEKLGGEVGVESEVGEGSVFTFTLPGKLTGGHT